MNTEKYIKPIMEVVEMELTNNIMNGSDKGYDLDDTGDYNGPAGAKRKSFWSDED